MLDSLYFRLNLTALIVLLVFLTATGAVLDAAYEESARQSLQQRMQGQIYQLLTAAELVETGQLMMPLPTHLPIPELALPDSGVYAFISQADTDKPLWRSPSLIYRTTPEPMMLQVGEQLWKETVLDNGKNVFLLGYGFQRSVRSGIYSFNFYLMNDSGPLYQQISRYRGRLWGGLASAALVLLATQLWVLRWGLSPLRKVGQELNSIEAGASNQIHSNYPREVKHLTDKINTLLTQERDRQTRYRNALADLAHSLKTPLAILLGAADQNEDLPETVIEQSSRMMRIVERQLQRAGTANHSTALQAVALYPIVGRIAASLSKVYLSKHIDLINNIDPSLNLRIDESDMIELVGNLLDNAYKWCRSRIEITAYKTEQHTVISFTDDGPGIDALHIDEILQRGGRIDESIPGHGIGLSIVAEIVEAYQGKLEFHPSRFGGAEIKMLFEG